MQYLIFKGKVCLKEVSGNLIHQNHVSEVAVQYDSKRLVFCHVRSFSAGKTQPYNQQKIQQNDDKHRYCIFFIWFSLKKNVCVLDTTTASIYLIMSVFYFVHRPCFRPCVQVRASMDCMVPSDLVLRCISNPDLRFPAIGWDFRSVLIDKDVRILSRVSLGKILSHSMF